MWVSCRPVASFYTTRYLFGISCSWPRWLSRPSSRRIYSISQAFISLSQNLHNVMSTRTTHAARRFLFLLSDELLFFMHISFGKDCMFLMVVIGWGGFVIGIEGIVILIGGVAWTVLIAHWYILKNNDLNKKDLQQKRTNIDDSNIEILSWLSRQ